MRKLYVPLVAVGLALMLVSPTSAAPTAGPTPTTDPAPAASTRSAAAWLASQVNASGYITGYTPGQPDLGTTSQAAIAFAASGLYRNTAERIETYLAANVATLTGAPQPSAGALAYLIVGAVANGRDPRNFGGVNLVTALKSLEQTTGTDTGLFGSTTPTYDGAYRQGLSLWALHLAGEASDSSANTWLTRQQCANGGWLAYRADTSLACPAADPAAFQGPDTNATSLALLGLHGQGVNPAVDAVAWLRSVRTANGGWSSIGDPAGDPDANSTGLVLQSLVNVTGAADPAGLGALRTFQLPCDADPADRGGVAFQPFNGQLTPDSMATVQALPALAGRTMGQTANPYSYEEPVACTPAPSPNQRFVMSAYQDFLHRQPTASELNVAAGLDAGTTNRQAVVNQLAASPQRVETIVQDLYLKTLGRPGEPAGVSYWVNRISSGTPVAEVAAGFYSSNEYYGRAGATDPAWVTDLYGQLLHRSPDSAGLDYWVGQVRASSRYSVALRFFQSPESARDRVTGLYQVLLGRAPDAGGLAYWSDRVVVDGDIALAANLAASPEYFNRAQVLYP